MTEFVVKDLPESVVKLRTHAHSFFKCFCPHWSYHDLLKGHDIPRKYSSVQSIKERHGNDILAREICLVPEELI